MPDVAEEHGLEPLLGGSRENGLPASGDPNLRYRSGGCRAVAQEHRCLLRVEREPVEGMWTQGREVRSVAHARHLVAAEKLDRHQALPLAEVQLDRLQESREVRDTENLLRLVMPH